MMPVRSDLFSAGANPGPTRPWTGLLASLGLTALATVVSLALFAEGAIANVGLLYLIPVLIAATRFGLAIGVVTGLASSLAYNYFFIPPTHTFTIENPQNIITVLVLLAVAVVASQLAAQARAQALLARARADRNATLAGFARQLTAIRTVDDLAALLCREIGPLFDVQTVFLLRDQDSDRLTLRAAVPQQVRLESLDHAAADWCCTHNRRAGRSTDRGNAAEWQFLPLGTAERVLAVFGLARSDAAVPVGEDRLPLLLSLLDQAGLALERIRLEAEMAALSQGRERDRLRQALLSSVSHDLRTPLTTILGALHQLDATGPDQRALLASARTEANRLNRFVANLLDMVRIETGAVAHRLEAVDLAEAVASALDDLGGVLQGHAVTIAVPADLPLVLVDPQLFHHCLINLIDNAAKHGGPCGTIDLRAGREGATGLALHIADTGPGIAPGQAQRIFETFVRGEGSDRHGGSGLGLGIVKGFAEAMNLAVSAANRSDGPGAIFSLHFPAATLKDLPQP